VIQPPFLLTLSVSVQLVGRVPIVKPTSTIALPNHVKMVPRVLMVLILIHVSVLLDTRAPIAEQRRRASYHPCPVHRARNV